MAPARKKPVSQTPTVFKDYHFSFSGVFDNTTHNQLATLVKGHGAGYTAKITKKTTHLVVTSEDFQNNSSKVVAAKARGDVTIVTVGFVDDSVAKGVLASVTDYNPDVATATVAVSAAKKDTNRDNKRAKAPSKKRKAADDADDDDGADDDAIDDVKKPDAKRTKRAIKGKELKASSVDATTTADMTATSNADDSATEVKEVAKKNATKKLKSLKVPVDALVPSASAYKVYIDPEDGTIWDAALNQTNIGNNNNKFYFIQVLERSSSSYACFMRWGRVGAKGETKFVANVSLEKAKKVFCSKFKEKTVNSWADRANFSSVYGKYTLLERDYGDDDSDDEEIAKKEKSKGKEKHEEGEVEPDSKLDPKVQEIVAMIFNQEMMNKQMESLNYNTEKFPLGKLKKKTITDGYNALKELSLVLTDSQPSEPSNKKKEIERLSNLFYTVVPHDFGRQRPPLINSPQALKEKLQLVESLAEIEIAQSLMKVGSLPRDADGNLMNRLDAHFASLKLNKLESFDHAHNEFVLIRDYVKNTHGQTHSGYDLEVVDAFRLERHSEPERFKEAGSDKLSNRALLWHGSRLTNFVGILSQGLRIAPPEAPVSGYMFGKGVYFADCVSKSANYCFTNQTDNEALMLLCEVALGETYELTNSDFYAAENSKKAGKTATLGVGRSQPDPKGKKYLNDGTLVPCGQVINPETPQARNTCLQYNEYIVYDIKQIKFRYLIKLRFNYKQTYFG